MSSLEPAAHEMQVEIDKIIQQRNKDVPPEVFLSPTLFSIAISLKRIADTLVGIEESIDVSLGVTRRGDDA